MGTSKCFDIPIHLSVMPFLAVLTGTILRRDSWSNRHHGSADWRNRDWLIGEGYTAEAIASAAAFWVAIYSLILGLFRLGFLLDFIPLPVLPDMSLPPQLPLCFNSFKNYLLRARKVLAQRL
jgi:hypothetical protein